MNTKENIILRESFPVIAIRFQILLPVTVPQYLSQLLFQGNNIQSKGFLSLSPDCLLAIVNDAYLRTVRANPKKTSTSNTDIARSRRNIDRRGSSPSVATESVVDCCHAADT